MKQRAWVLFHTTTLFTLLVAGILGCPLLGQTQQSLPSGSLREERQPVQHQPADSQSEPDSGQRATVTRLGATLTDLTAQGRRFDQQLLKYETTLKIANAKGISKNLETAYRNLSEWHARDGNYARAYEYERLRNATHDSLLRRENQQNLADQQARLQAEKKTALARWEANNQVMQEADARNRALLRNILFGAFGFASLLAIFLYRNNQRAKNSNQLLKQQNEEIQQQKEEMEAQRDRIEEESRKLEELNSTKDKFFSIVAHDLRGPINSLSSFSNLLANEQNRLDGREIKLIAQELNKAVKNTSRLTDNLLTWARLQMNSLEYRPCSVDLNKIVEDNLALFQVTAQQKRIRLRVESPTNLKVQADESQLRFVLRNLTANALKFTNQDGEVSVSVQPAAEHINISVTDTGVGISKETMEKIFRIDAKHSTLGTNGEKGTGLGLVLCKEFVEKNGGQLLVSSEPGKGSTFSMLLPRGDKAA